MPDWSSRSASPAAAPKELCNSQVEQALLGALLSQPQLLDAVPASFAVEHYADPLHAEVHRGVMAFGRPGSPAGLLVAQALAQDDSQTRGYIGKLMGAAMSMQPSYIAQLANTVTDLHRRRQMVDVAERLRQDAFATPADRPCEASLARALIALDGLSANHEDQHRALSLDEAMDAALTAADEAAKRDGLPGISTGMPSVDNALGGLEPSTLNILAGRPGMGKSAIGWQWAIAAAREGHGVLAISLEMSAKELGRRALCAVSGLPVIAMKRGQISSYGERLVAARRELNGLPLTIEDSAGQTTAMMMLRARAAQRRHGLRLIVVDHLHIVRSEDADARHGGTWAIGRISNALKRMAKEFECPVLALAQLNRGPESRDDKRPTKVDLKQAGDIEQDADTIMFVYRPEYYLPKSEPEHGGGETYEKWQKRVREWDEARVRLRGKAELILDKVRDGAEGVVPLRFDGPTTSFSEVGNG